MRQYAETILNAISAHVAVINAEGFIIETNLAWQRFASSNRVDMRPDMLHVNYLDICDAVDEASGDNAGQVARGIRQVIAGEMEEFVMDYPCHSPKEKRWFYMRAVRVPDSDPLNVVISHENITSLKLAQEQLRQREQELEQKTRHLEDANAALRGLIRQRDKDIRDMETTMFNNLHQSVFPFLDQIKLAVGPGRETGLVQLVESELNHITSPFLKQLSSLKTLLTPQEIRVATLIKEGKSSKEMADLLHLSMTTIQFHRRNLRDKLGLRHTGTNLHTYLMGLEK